MADARQAPLRAVVDSYTRFRCPGIVLRLECGHEVWQMTKTNVPKQKRCEVCAAEGRDGT